MAGEIDDLIRIINVNSRMKKRKKEKKKDLFIDKSGEHV